MREKTKIYKRCRVKSTFAIFTLHVCPILLLRTTSMICGALGEHILLNMFFKCFKIHRYMSGNSDLLMKI